MHDYFKSESAYKKVQQGVFFYSNEGVDKFEIETDGDVFTFTFRSKDEKRIKNISDIAFDLNMFISEESGTYDEMTYEKINNETIKIFIKKNHLDSLVEELIFGEIITEIDKENIQSKLISYKKTLSEIETNNTNKHHKIRPYLTCKEAIEYAKKYNVEAYNPCGDDEPFKDIKFTNDHGLKAKKVKMFFDIEAVNPVGNQINSDRIKNELITDQKPPSESSQSNQKDISSEEVPDIDDGICRRNRCCVIC